MTRAVLSGRITQGPLVEKFESAFASKVGVEHGIGVNSGSSANLIGLACLTANETPQEYRVGRGDEIITPALNWPTSVFPIIQLGATPVFVDVEPETYCIDPESVEAAVSSKTKVLWPVHLLGHPADMARLVDIADNHKLMMIEDVCEAHGSRWQGKPTGSFGILATFSFFAGHHMTTGEGGMIVTSNSRLARLAKSLRAFGRYIPSGGDEPSPVFERMGDYSPRFIFTEIGYSLKLTEMQAAMGLEQLRKLQKFIEIRRRNVQHLRKKLSPFTDYLQLPVEKAGATNSYFGFPILVRENAPFGRAEFVQHLEEAGVETRPLMAGNLIDQPCVRNTHFRVSGSLTNTKRAKDRAFFIGIHQSLSREDLDYVSSCVEDFMTGFR